MIYNDMDDMPPPPLKGTEPWNKTLFDSIIQRMGWFESEAEVPGTLEYVLHGQDTPKRPLKIDRILFPTEKLLERGWNHGPIGVEIKADKSPLHKTMLQCFDYRRCFFQPRNHPPTHLRYVAMYPFPTQHVPSLLIGLGLATCYVNTYGDFCLHSGDINLMPRWNSGTIRQVNTGRKFGSR